MILEAINFFIISSGQATSQNRKQDEEFSSCWFHHSANKKSVSQIVCFCNPIPTIVNSHCCLETQTTVLLVYGLRLKIVGKKCNEIFQSSRKLKDQSPVFNIWRY